MRSNLGIKIRMSSRVCPFDVVRNRDQPSVCWLIPWINLMNNSESWKNPLQKKCLSLRKPKGFNVGDCVFWNVETKQTCADCNKLKLQQKWKSRNLKKNILAEVIPAIWTENFSHDRTCRINFHRAKSCHRRKRRAYFKDMSLTVAWWVVLHTWACRVAHMNWLWLRCVTDMKGSCYKCKLNTYEWALWHT